MMTAWTTRTKNKQKRGHNIMFVRVSCNTLYIWSSVYDTIMCTKIVCAHETRLNDLPLFPLELTILSSERAEALFICVPPTAIINRGRRQVGSHAQPIVQQHTHNYCTCIYSLPTVPENRTTIRFWRINPHRSRAHYIGIYTYNLSNTTVYRWPARTQCFIIHHVACFVYAWYTRVI